MRYHLTPLRMANIKKTKFRYQVASKVVEKRETLYTVGVHQLGARSSGILLIGMVTLDNNYEYTFQTAERMDFKSFHHKEMIYICLRRYVSTDPNII